jgi:hypothetical protein
MGTRHLTIIKSGEKVFGQYGQWDGYPRGHGIKVLDYLKSMHEPHLRENFAKAHFLTPEEHKALVEKFDSGDALPGFITLKDATDLKRHYPQLDRDMGAGVLMHIENGDDLRYANEIEFAADSLFCEWAYMVDLDERRLRVFRGFVTEPLEDGQFFKQFFMDKKPQRSASGTDYYPVREIASFSFDNLPLANVFVEASASTCAED